jgi:hypothetical protein
MGMFCVKLVETAFSWVSVSTRHADASPLPPVIQLHHPCFSQSAGTNRLGPRPQHRAALATRRRSAPTTPDKTTPLCRTHRPTTGAYTVQRRRPV